MRNFKWGHYGYITTKWCGSWKNHVQYITSTWFSISPTTMSNGRLVKARLRTQEECNSVIYTRIRLFLVAIGCKWVAWKMAIHHVNILHEFSVDTMKLKTPYLKLDKFPFCTEAGSMLFENRKNRTFSSEFKQWVWVLIMFNTFPRLYIHLTMSGLHYICSLSLWTIASKIFLP